jgi:hypothetical protein
MAGRLDVECGEGRKGVAGVALWLAFTSLGMWVRVVGCNRPGTRATNALPEVNREVFAP